VWAIIAVAPFDATANRAYKAMSDAGLYEFNDGGSKKGQLAEIAKGDTVYATAATEAFIAEHDGERMPYIPVEYKGMAGSVMFSSFYPVRIESSDTLRFVSDSALKDRSPLERFLMPEMNWAMNHSGGPASWLLWILAFSAVAAAAAIMYSRGVLARMMPLACGLSLVAVSACEIMYLLSYHNNVLWFIMPSCVGGWGHTILNFLLLAIVVGIQTGGLYFVWRMVLNSDPDEEAPKWIVDASFWPVVLGIALMIMMWVDSNDIEASSYLIALGTLLIPAVAGMGWLFYQKRFSDGIIYPSILFLGSLGLSAGLMIMSMLIVLVIVVVAILAVAILAALSFLSAFFGGEEVEVYTRDGRVVKGTKNWDGTVSGRDGRKYHVK
ncbi:MAG: hypothetical protein K2L21_06980, partial [Muribaculaceae bacterium]|nr:hypothetical protein [Muribaculaceae bacterium]